MNYPKFESLITSRALYFSRIDNFTDKYEGKWARTNLETNILVSDAKRGSKEFNEDRRILHEAVDDILRLIYVNCFTIRDVESERMWAEYTDSTESVAIQTDFSKLKHSFVENARDNRVFTEVYASKVRYLQNDMDYMDEWSVLFPILYKRKKFEFENELRLFTTHSGIELAIRQTSSEDLRKSGKTSIADDLNLGTLLHDYPSVSISIDPKILIERVVVHPKSDSKFLGRVQRLLINNEIEIAPSLSSINRI
jgi:hypothetical protein